MFRQRQEAPAVEFAPVNGLDLDATYSQPAEFGQLVDDLVTQRGITPVELLTPAGPTVELPEAPTVQLQAVEVDALGLANRYYSQTGEIGTRRIAETAEVGRAVDTVLQKIADFLHVYHAQYEEYYQTIGVIGGIWGEFNTVRTQLLELMEETSILDATYHGIYTEQSWLQPEVRELLAQKRAMIAEHETYGPASQQTIDDESVSVDIRMQTLEQQAHITLNRSRVISRFAELSAKLVESNEKCEIANDAAADQNRQFQVLRATIEDLARRHDAAMEHYYALYSELTTSSLAGIADSDRILRARADIGANIIRSMNGLSALPLLADAERTPVPQAPVQQSQLPGRGNRNGGR